MRFTSIFQKTNVLNFQLRDYTDDKLLQVKHEQSKNERSADLRKKLKWDEIKEAILSSSGKNANRKKQDEVKDLLDKFKLNTRSMISEDVDGDTISDAAYYLFQVFYFKHQSMNESYSQVNSEENLVHELNKSLTQIFPLCSRNLVEKTFSLVETILSNVQNKSQIFDKLFANEEDNESRFESKYGQNVDYIDPSDIYKNNMKYPFSTDLSTAVVYNDDSEEVKFDFPVISNETKTDELDQLQLKWMNEIDNDVVKIVYELLSSGKSSDELQNELLETIGFDKFDLIGYLLTNRSEICKSYKRVHVDQNKGQTKAYASSQPIVNKHTASNEIANVLSTEIVVHTKTEKQINKLIRKEEKKLNKFSKTNRGAEFDSVLCEEFSGLIDADQNVLRKIREEQLTEARLLHLYNKNRELLGVTRSQAPKINYPFVFDRLLQAKQTMAHIAGSKILLPEDISRVDNKQYEQIHIPAVNTAADSSMNIKLVDVNQLDDNIGKIAFRNVKFLNRIQSVVFQSAYSSNENLLICAPTGFLNQAKIRF